MSTVVDNDVLFKGACYGLLDKLVWTTSSSGVMGVLGSARFVVPKKIEKANLNGQPAVALGLFLAFLRQAETLEPTDREQRMAADLELAAQMLGVSLDTGESQLCAIVVQRSLPLLVTGDKRAVAAIESLIDSDARLVAICEKVKCLEQVFLGSVVRHGCATLRTCVCSEPGIDKALSICFSCKTRLLDDATVLEGLQSYIKDLRQRVTRVLAP